MAGPPAAAAPPSAVSILVAERQRGNPLLAHVKELKLTFSDALTPDFQLSPTVAALFLSLRYHRLHGGYLARRIEELGVNFRLRLLLCLVDLPDYEKPLEEITVLTYAAEVTLLIAFSLPEAARLLQAFKQLEEKSPDIIQGRLEDHRSFERAVEVLTTVASLNKVDAAVLLREFGSFKNLVAASKQQVARCPGIGPKKLKDLWRALHGSLEKPDAYGD